CRKNWSIGKSCAAVTVAMLAARRHVTRGSQAIDFVPNPVEKGMRAKVVARPTGHGKLGGPKRAWLERDDFSSNRHLALIYCWSMIFSENRYPFFGIML